MNTSLSLIHTYGGGGGRGLGDIIARSVIYAAVFRVFRYLPPAVAFPVVGLALWWFFRRSGRSPRVLHRFVAPRSYPAYNRKRASPGTADPLRPTEGHFRWTPPR